MDHAASPELTQLLQSSAIPGVAIALLRDAKLEWIDTAGVMHAHIREPLHAEHIFGVASLSKPVFAYGVLLICRARVLDLDAPLREYLDAPYEQDPPQLERITARMVLSHTTGLPNERRADQALRIRQQPGTAFGYSGEGYRYLQHVLEHVTGLALETYFQAEVFAPLGMHASSYVWPTQHERLVVTGHDQQAHPLPKWKPERAHAGASLLTTPGDYARFLGAMLAPDELRAPLAAQELAAMFAPQVRVNNDIAWGLGWGLHTASESGAFWHWGHNGDGFTSFALGCRATHDAVVIMTNGLNGPRVYEPLVNQLLAGHEPVFAFLRAVDRYMH